MDEPAHSLVLRLAGPLQSWGVRSQFNRRETGVEPSKSGVIGLLAAAQGRRRQEPIKDLLGLILGVRTDQPGSLLRDYHTVSDYRGHPLPNAEVDARGRQKRATAPGQAKHKYTHVTERFYLEDAVFVAAVGGPADLLGALRQAVRRPAFPLALGRRTCVPIQPVLLEPAATQGDRAGLWAGDPLAVLRQVLWQASAEHLRMLGRGRAGPATVDLPVTVDSRDGDDVLMDLPCSFDPKTRSFGSRPVRHAWVSLRTPFGDADRPGHRRSRPLRAAGVVIRCRTCPGSGSTRCAREPSRCWAIRRSSMPPRSQR